MLLFLSRTLPLTHHAHTHMHTHMHTHAHEPTDNHHPLPSLSPMSAAGGDNHARAVVQEAKRGADGEGRARALR